MGFIFKVFSGAFGLQAGDGDVRLIAAPNHLFPFFRRKYPRGERWELADCDEHSRQRYFPSGRRAPDFLPWCSQSRLAVLLLMAWKEFYGRIPDLVMAHHFLMNNNVKRARKDATGVKSGENGR